MRLNLEPLFDEGHHRHHPEGPRGRHLGGRHGFRGGRERLLDSGEMKLVILKLLAEKPSYGYQLMKELETRMAGGYTPSAGAIYPTLTLLEEEGYAEASTDSPKKTYSVTAEGLEFLQENQAQVDAVFDRLSEAGRHFERGRSPEIMRSFMKLRGAVTTRVARESITTDQIQAIAGIIENAAREIEEL